MITIQDQDSNEKRRKGGKRRFVKCVMIKAKGYTVIVAKTPCGSYIAHADI